jgi:regulator of sigma D
MEFELNRFDLYDYQIDEGLQLIVECEPDAEYSPQDRIYNRFCWSLILRNKLTNICQDITDELSEGDFAIVEKQVEEFFEEFFND